MSDQPKQGMDGCARGCAAIAMAGVVLAIMLCSAAWFLYGKLVDRFTSPGPMAVQIDPPTATQYQQAEAALNRLRQAVANNVATTVEFTAADVNALIARHPDFSDARNRMRASMADSAVTLDLSLPLDAVPLPRLKGRWFNGKANFVFRYAVSEFNFQLNFAETNGDRFPSSFVSSFGSSFTKSFNTGFHESLGKNSAGTRFWSRINRIEVQGDKLVVTTQAAG